jgi:hypothetical protein
MAVVKIKRKFKYPVTANGIYASVPIDTYHGPGFIDGHAVSSSDLRTLWQKSPRHFFLKWRGNPKRAKDDPTEAMTLGRASHHLLLGEAQFKKYFVGQPDKIKSEDSGKMVLWHNNRTECIKWNDEQRNAGLTILKPPQLKKIVGMGRGLASWPTAVDLLNGEIECSMVARDPETGLWLIVRPDAIPTTSGDYSDLKTTADVSDYGIARAIASGGLHQQGALVWEVCELLRLPFTSFNLVFQESDEPFCTRIVPIDEDDLIRGRLQNRYAMRKIRHGIDTGEWMPPGEMHIRPTLLPGRERDIIDARLQTAGFDVGKKR